MDIIKILFYAIHAVLSIGLIVLVVLQTSRSEGLGAVGGSSSSPTMRGRQGVDEKLAEYTKWVAGGFMIVSALIYLLSMRNHW